MSSPKPVAEHPLDENHHSAAADHDHLSTRRLVGRQNSGVDALAQVVLCKRLAKMPKLFLARRRQMRQIAMENTELVYSDENAGLLAASTREMFEFEHKATTFDEYTRKLEEALVILRSIKQEEYESETALRVLRFLENLIHQPKEWISGAKLKLSEMKFPETAMILMHSYREKGYLVRRIVFLHSILLYNSMGNFTDHEFDKEGLIRKQSADAGVIEFACEVLSVPSYRESLAKCYVINSPDEVINNEDFDNYQKILYICDSALTILYNVASLPELKIHFRECNAINVVAEYTRLSSKAIRIQFAETEENADRISRLKELKDIVSTIRVTSSLLLSLIINEDEDNLLAMNTSDVLPLLSGMIQTCNRTDERFYGFSFIELVDGLSKLMVRGRTHKYIDQNLVNLLLNILEKKDQDDSLLECVSNAILNASFDEKVQRFLDSPRAIEIIKSAQDRSDSQLVQKNCEAILWTLNRIPHREVSSISQACVSQGHVMISYNRSVTAMCLKIRDRLKALNYKVWLDVDNINGGVLESMAGAVENAAIVLICMNEQYKQSYYCRLEAEYATELRKPCIPCLMQPRFRPYGWLGIIKGAKIHVDFATFPFEDAFAILIREIETTRQNSLSNTTSSPSAHGSAAVAEFASVNSVAESNPSPTAAVVPQRENPVASWNVAMVKQWLQTIGLGLFERALLDIDGPLLWQLYQMKRLSADSYYRLLDKYFDRILLAHMSDTLKFDLELERLLQ